MRPGTVPLTGQQELKLYVHFHVRFSILARVPCTLLLSELNQLVLRRDRTNFDKINMGIVLIYAFDVLEAEQRWHVHRPNPVHKESTVHGIVYAVTSTQVTRTPRD